MCWFANPIDIWLALDPLRHQKSNKIVCSEADIILNDFYECVQDNFFTLLWLYA
jgi:hypothetical protein